MLPVLEPAGLGSRPRVVQFSDWLLVLLWIYDEMQTFSLFGEISFIGETDGKDEVNVRRFGTRVNERYVL